MFISSVTDSGGEGGGVDTCAGMDTRDGEDTNLVDDDVQYQTANELFELMAQNNNFRQDDDPLTQSDLVLLYQNLDLGTQLMSEATEARRTRPNQHVETIIHQDSDDSEVSAICSNEDFNKERIEVFKNTTSFGDVLCQKLGGIKIPTSDLTFEYDKHFFRGHLTAPNRNSIPMSLIDLIFSKNFEENYGVYLESVIQHVKVTIEQLKRISNGDYLTDRAKEKWLEGNYPVKDERDLSIATTTSVPFDVKHDTPKWDDIVHSEIDVRSLTKILEKRIVLEIPRMVQSSYKGFFKPSCANSLVLSCKKPAIVEVDADRSRSLDVVVQIQRTDDVGDGVENIGFNVILETKSAALTDYQIPALPYIEDETNKLEEITEEVQKETIKIEDQDSNEDNAGNETEFETAVEEITTETKQSNDETSCDTRDESSIPSSEPFNKNANESWVNNFDTDMLYLKPEKSVSFLDDQVTTKRRSPTRKRVKSPYENHTFAQEEKKRRKLLEIREKRKRKKLASIENRNFKSRFSKVEAMPQAANSVTRLSISNKSFYNSIFGHSFHNEKMMKTLRKERKVDPELKIPNNSEDEDDPIDPIESAKAVTGVCVDNTVTQVQFKMPDSDRELDSNPHVEDIIVDKNLKTSSVGSDEKQVTAEKTFIKDVIPKFVRKPMFDNRIEGKKKVTLECRQSIDKIYDLLRKVSGVDLSESKSMNAVDKRNSVETSIGKESAIGSDSGTSLKHNLTSSDPSCFSFANQPSLNHLKPAPLETIIPKVIISNKYDAKGSPKNKSISMPIKSVPDNPLKAISQLLHEFDTVQKKRQKSAARETVRSPRRKKNEAGDARAIKEVSFRNTPKVETTKKPPSPRRPKPPSKIEEKIVALKRDRTKYSPIKKVVDILDEVKEARGEAVKGPTNYSRLDALARPKKAYVQAHSEEMQNRIRSGQYRTPVSNVSNARSVESRNQRKVSADTSSVSVKSRSVRRPPAPPVERRRSANSPEKKRVASPRKAASPKKKNAVDAQFIKKPPLPSKPQLRNRPVAPSSFDSGSHDLPYLLQMTRVPLVPDFELFSLTSSPKEGSSEIGVKLHQIVSKTILDSSQQVTSNSDDIDVTSIDLQSVSDMSTGKLMVVKEVSDTKCSNDLFGDKTVVTAVANITHELGDTTDDDLLDNIKDEVSTTEITKLENALYKQICVGSFSKRLRIKNFTLTPRHSMQQILLLQSGDNKSFLSNSSMPPIKICASKSDVSDLLSNRVLDFLDMNIPMQLATVGFALPEVGQPKIIETEYCQVEVDEIEVKQAEIPEIVVTEDSECVTPSSAEAVGNSDSTVVTGEFSEKDDEGKIAEDTKNGPDETEIELDLKACPNNLEIDAVSVDHKVKGDNEIKGDTTKVDDKAEENDNVDGTSSLDMLVKLLNEIQKITSCQTNLTNGQLTPILSKDNEISSLYQKDVSKFRTALESSAREIISLTSLENMRQLESSQSLLSLVVSSECDSLPLYLDKEISVNFPEKTFANNFNCVPSKLISTICHSTNVSNSLMGALTRSSSPTMYSLDFSEFLTSDSNTTLGFTSDVKESDSSECRYFTRKSSKYALLEKASSVDVAVTKKYKRHSSDGVKMEVLDPMMKVKRDVLVTVYSVLVFTVFAALSIPCVIYSV